MKTKFFFLVTLLSFGGSVNAMMGGDDDEYDASLELEEACYYNQEDRADKLAGSFGYDGDEAEQRMSKKHRNSPFTSYEPSALQARKKREKRERIKQAREKKQAALNAFILNSPTKKR